MDGVSGSRTFVTAFGFYRSVTDRTAKAPSGAAATPAVAAFGQLELVGWDAVDT
jgi:hypothetical protein